MVKEHFACISSHSRLMKTIKVEKKKNDNSSRNPQNMIMIIVSGCCLSPPLRLLDLCHTVPDPNLVIKVHVSNCTSMAWAGVALMEPPAGAVVCYILMARDIHLAENRRFFTPQDMSAAFRSFGLQHKTAGAPIG
jgi:hypothetical protein